MAAAPSKPPFPKGSKRPWIFISHSSADQKQAIDLHRRLQSVGTPWIGVVDLRPGDEWEHKIFNAVRSADVAVVCISRNSNSRSGFLEKETSWILGETTHKVPLSIIPVRFDESPVPKILESFLYVDLFKTGGYEQLLAAVRGIGLRTHDTAPDPTTSSSRPATQYINVPSIESEESVGTPIVEADNQAGDGELTIEQARQWFPDNNFLLVGGDTGKEVKVVQQRLNDSGHKVFADGVYGASTQKAVLDFQRKKNLRSTDGFVGPNTWAALFDQEPVELKTASTAQQKTGTKQSTPRVKSVDSTVAAEFNVNVEAGTAETSTTAPTIKEGLDEEARERKALNDKPVEDVSKDTLGFRDYVFALRDFIASQSTTTPLTISINGAWGSGKSSLMRMLQNELEPSPPPGLWRVKIKWLIGFLYGTFFWTVGWVLVRLRHRDAGYIKLAFAFDPDEDVNDTNFDRLFGKCVDLSLRQDFGKQNGEPDADERLEKERQVRTTKTRFWARQAARRRKMTPPSHPTIWFNAWKFNQQEQLWAALATAVLGQLKTKYGFFARIYLLTKLSWKRGNISRTINQVSRKLIVPIIVAAVVALYQIKRETLLQFFPSLRGSTWLSRDTWLWLAPVLAAMWQAVKAIDDPFKIPIDELMTSPDYKGKIGFISTFEADFGRIVETAIRRSIFWQPRKLVIFIDDLDRCGPTQAAAIVEAINLFLDSVGCVFVLGMDMNAVAISIEVKYKELTERMRTDAPDDVSPGVLFLDKIVQIPFNVPRPNKAYIEALARQMTEPASRELPKVAPTPLEPTVSSNGGSATAQAGAPRARLVAPTMTPIVAKIDRAGFAHEDIREAILFAASLLKENPRQVKRFINLFRLQVYIAHERGLLSEDADRLNPRKLAIWVAWYMQWPEILKLLASSRQTAEVRKNLTRIADGLTPITEAVLAWQEESDAEYIKILKSVRARESSSASHWSHLPWQLWIRDDDFLRCLKELEPYWQRPALLDSMLDMTQVTVSEQSAAADARPPITLIESPVSEPA